MSQVLAIWRQLQAAPRGLWGVLKGDPAWTGAFGLTTGGFLRSFIAPLLALPAYLLAVAVVDASGFRVDGSLGRAALTHCLDAFGFPLAVGLLAGPLGVRAGYPAFVVVANWATPYLNVALLALSLLVRLGTDGAALFYLASLGLLALSLALTWRIAQATLSRELAVVALVVVLAFASGVLSDAVAQRLLH